MTADKMAGGGKVYDKDQSKVRNEGTLPAFMGYAEKLF